MRKIVSFKLLSLIDNLSNGSLVCSIRPTKASICSTCGKETDEVHGSFVSEAGAPFTCIGSPRYVCNDCKIKIYNILKEDEKYKRILT